MNTALRALGTGALVLGVAAFAASCQQQPAQQAAAPADSTYKPSPPPAPVVVNVAGKQAYLAYCAMCHGDRGAGDGPLATELAKLGGSAPVNIADASRLDALGKAGLARVIERGGAHTGRSNLMPAWGEKLEPAVVDSLSEFLMQLAAMNPGVPTATIEKYLAAPAGTPANGRRWFVYYCSGCHGPEGKGDGPNAERLRRAQNVRPRDLTDAKYFAERTDQDLYTTVALGGGHAGKSTMMPAWSYSLSPEQIKDLVAYLRVVSNTPSRP